MQKVLIACPTSQKKDYAFLEWYYNVRNLDYPKYKYDIMMVDNSKDKGYDKYLQSFNIVTRHVNPRNKHSMEFICESHNAIRDYFLWNDYDYLLHLESDVMINTQTLRTLLFHSEKNDLPVVSAAYFHGEDKTTSMLIHKLESYGNFKSGLPVKFKTCLSVSGKFLSVYACGIGCVLIRKDVMEKISFRIENYLAHADSFFYKDLFLNNIPVYLDASLILKHNSQNWNHNSDSIVTS